MEINLNPQGFPFGGGVGGDRTEETANIYSQFNNQIVPSESCAIPPPPFQTYPPPSPKSEMETLYCIISLIWVVKCWNVATGV